MKMSRIFVHLLTISIVVCSAILVPTSSYADGHTWTADNGNGTYTNPLFYEEFSDPDLIRVGDDYYLTGTTMHTMPGLPVLHSRDLVNWDFVSYAAPRLDMGPEYRMENGQDAYGQGIWAPSFRYHDGTFYIFTNVNRHNTQVYTAADPVGPWKHHSMNVSLHDLSVLFDDDGTIRVVWGYDEVHYAELNKALTDTIPGSGRIIVPAGSGAGEGSHFYKINGKYYITSTNYDPVCYMVALRSDNPTGPYEVRVISAKENLGIGTGWRLNDTRNGPPFNLIPPVKNFVGRIPMHQGGIVQIQSGEWWGFSMMDHNSIGRLLTVSPVTWVDGWPYFGLKGNLKRSPRTWVKPNTGFTSEPHAPYKRSDDFSGTELQPIWQWNHVPVDSKWSLTERKGYLRLHSLPAESFWHARNSLTQRAVGPESYATTEIDLDGLQNGDIAGLALLNLPFTWVGVAKNADGFEVRQYDQQHQKTASKKISTSRIWLRVHSDFDTEKSQFSYSTDGKNFRNLGIEYIAPYQLRTFQGLRFTLFNFNTDGSEGGYADFNDFKVDEPRSKGLTRPIPYGKTVRFTSLGDSTVLVNWKGFVRPVPANSRFAQGKTTLFKVLDRGNGRIALQSAVDGRYVTVLNFGEMAEVRLKEEEQGDASVFQWQDMLRNDLMLMSLKTHRYLFVDPHGESLTSANARGARPDRKGGACFSWEIVD